MILLFAWIVVALLTALVANSKNRSPIAWALLAIPLGLIATLVVACSTKLPAKDAVTATEPIRLADKTCPRCAESVKDAAKVCRFCGHEFS
ncbi:zinc ribbon domain-containing protein [Paraburkholderia sp. SIMBA_027]|uniref:zinc ribbon domain-containing protein n=1 Tax=Paraburkholderia sp. SIMBA_027 TaxID=3085770 RepID=UPI00397E17BF